MSRSSGAFAGLLRLFLLFAAAFIAVGAVAYYL